MSETSFVYNGDKIPVGGLPGQVLTKVGGPNFYTAWRSVPTFALDETGVTPGTYGSDRAVARFTVNSYGLLTFAGNVDLDAPTKTGTGATGTWGISITGNAATSTALATGRTIALSGDATGTSAAFNGTANITISTSLANSGVTAGTYNNSATAVTPLTIDAKGRVTAAGANVTITPAFSSITSRPTTVSGYGITDAPTFSGANAFTGANTFTNATGQIFRQAATQDGILLRGRAGGTTSLTVEIIPTTLTASRTLTAPNVSGTIITSGDTATVTNTMLANSTISGVALGGTLNTLTLGTGLTGTSYNGSAAVTAAVSYGTTAGTACQGNDARLSNTRNTTNAITFNNAGTGAASGTTFNGSAAVTVSHNTLGAAPLASPALTGTPTAPTATAGTSTTQIATTAFVTDGTYDDGTY